MKMEKHPLEDVSHIKNDDVPLLVFGGVSFAFKGKGISPPGKGRFGKFPTITYLRSF